MIPNSCFATSPKSQCEHQQDRQEADIRRGEVPEIGPFPLPLFPRDELIGDQACHGGDQRSQAAQVDPNDQVGKVLCKPGQQQRGGDIADHLAGGHAGKDLVSGDDLLQHSGEGREPSHIADENEEAHKGQQQAVVHTAENAPVRREQRKDGHDQGHAAGDDPGHCQKI